MRVFSFENFLLRSVCDHLFPCNPACGPLVTCSTPPPKKKKTPAQMIQKGWQICDTSAPNTGEEHVIWLAAGTWNVVNLHKYETSPRLFTFSGLTVWELFLDSIGDGAWSILFGFCLVNSAILLGGVWSNLWKIRPQHCYILYPPARRVIKLLLKLWSIEEKNCPPPPPFGPLRG